MKNMASSLNLLTLGHNALSSRAISVLDEAQTQAGWPYVRDIKQDGAHWECNGLSVYL